MKLIPFLLKYCTKSVSNLFVLLFLIVSAISTAQNKAIKDTTSAKEDTLGKKDKNSLAVLDNYIAKMATEELKEGKLQLNNNRITQWQNNNFNLIISEIQKANFLLKEGVDYKNFTAELDLLIKLKDDSLEGITNKRDKKQTIRNLSTTYLLLQELSKRTDERLIVIDESNQSLSTFQRRLDSLTSNKKLYIVPLDSISKINYYQRFVFMSKDLKSVNVNIKNAQDSIQKLQVMGNLFKYSLKKDIASINSERKAIYDNIKDFSKANIDKNHKDISFQENISYSFGKGMLVLIYYYVNYSHNIIIMMLFVIALIVFLKVLKRKYIDANLYNDLQYPKQLFEHPVAASLVIVFTIYQFILQLPPFIFSSFLWMISAFALTFLLRKSVSKYWFRVWLVILLFVIVAVFDNLLLRYSVAEENFIVFMNISGFILGLFLLINSREQGRSFVEKTIFASVIILIIFEIISFYYILTDQYNNAKMFMTNGFFTVIIAYLMVWTYYLIGDIKILSYYLKETDKERENLVLNPNKKTGVLTYVLLFVGWFILNSRNSYSFQTFIAPLKKAFYKPQTFGEFTFTYENIFVFFIVLFISAFLSSIVSFLTTETRTAIKNNRKSGVGSWLLLIRIAIISLGIVIAFASAGIPMDRLALVLSALGVGIGFGLQTEINNLVSGFIIAFEKPVNLDDVVEVGGQSGKMKSIGIRSSVISTWQGSDVIIPNGDLLKNNLVNWTLGKSRRRIDFNLSVSKGTDLSLVDQVLNDILDNNDQILKTSHNSIQVINFNERTIDFVVKFWVEHFEIAMEVKSDVLKAIDIKFKEYKI